jgi:DNA-binding response OmpR family regulator
LKFLIVEDEIGLRQNIVDYLSDDGNVCQSSDCLKHAIEKLLDYTYDCVILDIGLPDGEGFAVLNFLQTNERNESVLIISARGSLNDKIKGLNVGADDYLTKPFHLAELKARVVAIYRRKTFSSNNIITFKEISIDLQGRTVSVNGNVFPLTRKEYDILLYFIANKGKVISKNAIAEHLWGDEMDLHDQFDFIYTHIKNLRKKLTDAGCNDYIKSLYGIGYKFTS